jgi:hypothetical protein
LEATGSSDCVTSPEVGMETYFYSPQIANPQIFGLIPQSQISTFLR